MKKFSRCLEETLQNLFSIKMSLLSSNQFSQFIQAIKNYPALYTRSADEQDMQLAHKEIGERFQISSGAVDKLWRQIVSWHRRMHPNEDDTRFLLKQPESDSDDPWQEADDRMAESLSHFFIDDLEFLLK
ncbi:unnamed protein product [Auanema sp. JU1783]|nr:unnamed protein product [Auanema sp. JU1783]